MSTKVLTINSDNDIKEVSSVDYSLLNPDFFGHNYCINGNFDIWQRGTSFTNPWLNAYTADRIKVGCNADGGTPPTIVHSRQQLTSGELDKSFYYYRINSSGSGSGYGNNAYYVTALQHIENGTRLLCGAGKKITISFWIKSDIAGRIVTLETLQGYGSGGSPSSLECLTPLRITCNSTWTKISHTVTTNTLVGKTFGTNNGDCLIFQLWLQGGSTYNSRTGGVISWASGNIDIAQIQINAGDTALDYVAPILEDELRKCMRYYEKFAYVHPTNLGSPNNTFMFLVRKRITNPILTTSIQAGTGGAIANIGWGLDGSYGFTVSAYNSIPSNAIATADAEF